jgi:hypothetical protein
MPPQADRPKSKQAKKTAVKLAPVTVSEMSPAAQEQLAQAREYRVRYDQAVKNGDWAELAQWAYAHGLYVEAFYCAAAVDQSPLLLPKLHNTRFLVFDPSTKGWTMTNQMAFEKAMPARSSSFVRTYKKVVSELEQMEASESISSQTRLANLLVQADCPRGRELYRESIKEKDFYHILIREMKRAYLDDVTPERAWQASWLKPVAMNLWLIDEMIKLDPAIFTEAEKIDKAAKGKSTPKPPGMMPDMMGPGMGMMGPMGPGMELKPLPGLAHRLLLLQILARRGGLVSACLIGELFEADQDNTLFIGFGQGQVDPRLLTRFTEIYAEPLVRPIAKGFETFDGEKQQWQGVANVLARMNNDRMAALVFATAGNKRILSRDVVFSLAVGGSRYSLENLMKFIQASKVQDVDVESLFAAWTRLAPGSETSLWDTVSQFLPSGSASKQTRESRGQMGPEMFGPDAMPPGQLMPDGMAPGMPGGMPPGMPGMGPGGMPPMPQFAGSGKASERRRKDQKTHGWPLVRRFTSGVDIVSARAFLQTLGQLELNAESVKQRDSRSGESQAYGPGMYGPGMGGVEARPIDETAKAQVKRSAIQCLITLDDPKLADYFQNLIGDPLVGDYARLGLCVLDHQASCSALLTHFWKHPLELNDSVNEAKYSRSDSKEPAVTAIAGHIGVPLDPMGLPLCGVSARDALIYFDYRKAGEAFLASLGSFITHKDSYDNPQQVAEAACTLIDALGRWTPTNTAATLADLIESTSDFGLRGDIRKPGANQPQNILATNVRMKALTVLGEIGNQESMNVILRIATYSRPDELMGLAAKVALAKRGINGAADIFLDMLDPTKQDDSNSRRGSNIQTQLAEIDPALTGPDDIALLGLSRVRLNGRQIERTLGLVTTLGGQKSGRDSGGLQERLVLSLLEAGQGEVLTKLASMVGEIPVNDNDKKSQRNDPYYWNQTTEENQDELFLAMVQALHKQKELDDEDAVAAFVTAILRREEAVLIPDFETLDRWDPQEGIVRFEDSRSSSGLGRGGNFMPLMPDMSSPSMGTSKYKNGRNADRFQVNIKFQEVRKDKGWMPQQAAFEGLAIIARLANAERYLQNIKELEYFRYFADVLLWEQGHSEGGEELVRMLTAENNSKKEMYLQCLAMEQLQQSQGLDFTPLLAEVLTQSSNLLTRSMVGDSAMYVAIQAWREQMSGQNFQLNNPQEVGKVVEAWRPVVESKKYDLDLADRLVVSLAPLQADERTVKWLTDIVRVQCGRSEPVAESAVGSAVEMLRTLNSGGNDQLLDFYTTVLSLTYDPEKAREAKEKAKDRMTSAADFSMGPNPGMPGMLGPGPSDTKRTSRSRSSHNRQAGRSQPIAAYQSIGPLVIQAIGAMNLPEAERALLKIARSREDLLAVIAMHLYIKDPQQGRTLFRQLFTESGKQSELAEQAKLSLAFLMQQPDLANLDILSYAIVKADSRVGDEGIKVLGDLYKDNKLPPEFDVNKALCQIIQGLTSELRTRSEVKSVLDAAIKFAEPLQDTEITKLIERAQKTMEVSSKRSQSTPRRRR